MNKKFKPSFGVSSLYYLLSILFAFAIVGFFVVFVFFLIEPIYPLVLLTRARAGMVICIPTGNPNKTLSGFWEDNTRLPEFYDSTYEYLRGLGIDEI